VRAPPSNATPNETDQPERADVTGHRLAAAISGSFINVLCLLRLEAFAKTRSLAESGGML
jgi:hypothetical protein